MFLHIALIPNELQRYGQEKERKNVRILKRKVHIHKLTRKKKHKIGSWSNLGRRSAHYFTDSLHDTVTHIPLNFSDRKCVLAIAVTQYVRPYTNCRLCR